MQNDAQLLCQMASHHVLPSQWKDLDEEAKAALKTAALEWIHILQIDTDEYTKVTWGEYGSLSYWIKRADLQRLDFERCWAITDSI
ncbi:DUF1963 domain-containing protein [Ktedonobacter racemifer]|uniref:Uncharacterized protein n=1 Tax=Ktedonobacter racemifer DSM 44963 TaxID=485913 RepID=D6TS49_KTERA|nr:Protein of unknown function DUF1963 [Ktedonobacter racemifer DSM 44963]